MFKKGDETNKTCYRPVSILTALSKIFEKVVFDQIYEVYSSRLSANLSGYLRGHSCCTALLKVTEDWRASLDKREAVAAVTIDLSKAFDSVCHSLMLAKLRAYGFSPDAMDLLTAYLRNRRQRVKVDGACSNWAIIKAGVPQGSLLGPLLFNLYINDVNYAIKNMSMRLYADDTTGYAADVSPLVLQYRINTELSLLTSWLKDNYLQINTVKTQAMPVGKMQYEYDFKLNGSDIELTDSVKILGVILDRKLTYKEHISEQLRKACAKASALRQLRKFIPQDVMICLYKAYILPHLEYCAPLLVGIGKGLAQKMEDINYYILRTILGIPKGTPYEGLLKLANMKSLVDRRHYQSLVLLFKCMNNQGPGYISELFKLKVVKYNLRGSGTRLEQPRFELEWFHKSFSYIISQLWNNLPVKVRECDSVANFKASLRNI